ncbi:hypothetical protein LC612_44215 [Nostoc sp. CHAB 5834]|nr:hypothetical protein [Nostoc sp. CHAB 5834]
MMSSKKLISKVDNSTNLRAIGTAVLFLAAVLVGGCKAPQAAKEAPKPQTVYVSLESLFDAHPLASSLRDLEITEQRLRRENISRPSAIVEEVKFSPISRRAFSSANQTRNANARMNLQRNAEVTLRRYINSLRNTNQRIRDEKKAELEGIARARSAASEAEARATIENKTRLAIAGRSLEARNTRIRRNAARLNLSNNNVISVARDPVTHLPSKERLEEQVTELQKRDVASGGTNTKPFLTSDEARLTKLLRDLEALLANIRDANERDTNINNALIAEAIAAIRAENALWVETELAKSPLRDRSRQELAVIREELSRLLINLRNTEQAGAQMIGSISQEATLRRSSIGSLVSESTKTTDLISRLNEERNAIRSAIRKDITSAVRDAGLVRNLRPVFSSTSNTPNRTDEFRQWIFGNVDGVSMSNHSAPK